MDETSKLEAFGAGKNCNNNEQRDELQTCMEPEKENRENQRDFERVS